jgi:hypothetical protein
LAKFSCRRHDSARRAAAVSYACAAKLNARVKGNVSRATGFAQA